MRGTIYRVEDVDTGYGPYVAVDGYNREVYQKVHDHVYGKHPSPWEDIGRYPLDEEFCGFSTEKQLRRWFSNTLLKFILDRDFRVLVYQDVKITGKGKKQCLFLKPKGKTKIKDITKKVLKDIKQGN